MCADVRKDTTFLRWILTSAHKKHCLQQQARPKTPPHAHTHTHTPPPESSPAQVRSSGIMGNHSRGPSHLFHLRASQKHPRHHALCSPSLPLSSHTFSSETFVFFPSSEMTVATEETTMVLLMVMGVIFSFTMHV